MTNQFKMTGIIKHIGDTVQVSEKFQKREFVVTELSDKDPKYDQHISFQATQDKCDMLSSFGNGQSVTVSFNLRGREWTSPQGEVKYFNTLEAWRVEPSDEGSSPTPIAAAPVAAPQDEEDLPF
jgi:hypothetical protein